MSMIIDFTEKPYWSPAAAGAGQGHRASVCGLWADVYIGNRKEDQGLQT
jgi:hypothetical protein